MESSNSKERELQLTQRLAKQRHSNCMAWFEQLETHLHDLYLNSSSHAVDAFKPAFHSFFGEEHQTFRLKMFRNLDQLRLQLEKENLLEVNPRTCLDALRTQFKEFFASKRVNSSEHLNQCWQKDFKEYMFCEPDTYRRDLLENLDTLEAVIHRAVITYGKLQLQSQDVQINPVQAVDDSLIVSKSSWIESENNNALNTSVNETQLQQHESLVTESTTLEVNLNTDVKALDAGSVITESSRTKWVVQGAKKLWGFNAQIGINLVSTHFDVDTDMFGVHDLVGDEVVVESEVAIKAASTILVSAATTKTTVITNDEITLG
ncbi:hypothetical protein Tco_0374515 [Tanacetum coccineum]